jgi:phosphoribosylaminoimidazole (AIR) synthetase
MRRAFNMGIGFCVVTRRGAASGMRDAIARTGLGVFEIGRVVAGEGVRWEE